MQLKKLFWIIPPVTHLLISFYFFHLHLNIPTQIYDDGAYSSLGRQGNSLTEANELRTYGYLTFLALINKSLILFNLEKFFFVAVFFIQTLIYIFASNQIARTASVNKELKILIFFFLSINIFIAPYHSLTLTDSIFVSLSMLTIASVISLYHSATLNYISFFYPIFLFSLSFAVRPAALWLMPVVLVSILYFYQKILSIYPKFIITFFIGISPILFQSYLNKITFDTLSPFPIFDLGSKQISWGIQNIKYATWVGPNEGGIFYPSSNLVGPTLEPLSLIWYFNNPIDGVKLLLFKLIGAFDYDLLLPYSVTAAGSQKYLGLISLLIFLIGMTIISLNFKLKIKTLGPNWLPLLIFCSWAAVNLLSALELRFTLPILCYFILLVPLGLNELFKNKIKYFLFVIPIWFTLVFPIAAIAEFVRDQRIIP